MRFSLLTTLSLALASAVLAQSDEDLPPDLKTLDRNNDGKVTRDDMPKMFGQIDTDQDGVASAAELKAWFAEAKTYGPKSTIKAADSAAPVPDDIEKRAVVIMSDGTRMSGDLYLPRSRKPDEKLPGIVLCSGTGGTKKGWQARLAPIFSRAGYVCLAFDYRGWGESDPMLMLTGPTPLPAPDEKGEITVKSKAVRWQMNLNDQTFDIRCAIAFLMGQPEVDGERIGLMGSSYGGGLVTIMAGIDPRVKCVAAQVMGLGGPERDKAGYALMGRQARGETEPIPFETGKLGGKMAVYENMRTNPAKSVGYPGKDELARRIRIPMIFVSAGNEELSPPQENGGKFAAILSENHIPVKHHIIPGITHYGVYKEGFNEAAEQELAWFKEHLKGGAGESAGK